MSESGHQFDEGPGSLYAVVPHHRGGCTEPVARDGGSHHLEQDVALATAQKEQN